MAAVRAELMSAVEALLGPKTEADLKPPEKKKKTKVGLISVVSRGFVSHPARLAVVGHQPCVAGWQP